MKEVKYRYGQEVRIAKDVETTREIDFVISDNSRDRHKTVLPVDKWKLKNFNKNGIVGYQHNVYGGDMCNPPDPDAVIGKGKAFVEDEKVIGRIKFEPADLNPLAEKIFRKVLFGSLKATSVGFIELKEGKWGDESKDEHRGGKNETYYFDGQELIEFSIVNIPSNPNALKKSLRDQTSNALMYIKQHLGESYSFAKIESMTVRNVIDMLMKDGLDKDKKEKVETDNLEIEKAKRGAEMDIYYKEKELELLKIKEEEI